ELSASYFFFQAEDGIRDFHVTGVQTCALPILILMIFLFALYSEYNVFESEYLALGAVVTALTIYNGSVIAEIVRAGIRSLPKGRSEERRVGNECRQRGWPGE